VTEGADAIGSSSKYVSTDDNWNIISHAILIIKSSS